MGLEKKLKLIGLVFITISILFIIYVSLISIESYKTGQGEFVNSKSNSKPTTHVDSQQQSPYFSSLHNTKVLDNNQSVDKGNKVVDVMIPQGAGIPNYLSMFFFPTALHIHTGDTVRWINKDSAGHTVTAMALNSGLIWPKNSKNGLTTYSHTFDQPGIYAYFCQIHPYMAGIVYVDAPESQRELRYFTQGNNTMDVEIEIPQNAAYEPNFGPMFIPSGAVIPIGSKITWSNKDYVSHTATAPDGSFDTGEIKPGESKTILLNDRQGIISYYCKIHPWMQAMVSITS